jgi:hypothetical protein
MKFTKIGKHIINLSMITHIEVFESGGAKIYMHGSDSIRLDPPDSNALVASVNASEIHPQG